MIYVVKRKLFMILRSQLSQNWVKYIKVVVDTYNNTPLKKLGFLTPNDISSEKSSVDVDLSKKQFNIPTFVQPTFEEQSENQISFEKDSKHLQRNDYCYKFYDEKLFSKKYNISVRIICCLPFDSVFFSLLIQFSLVFFCFLLICSCCKSFLDFVTTNKPYFGAKI